MFTPLGCHLFCLLNFNDYRRSFKITSYSVDLESSIPFPVPQCSWKCRLFPLNISLLAQHFDVLDIPLLWLLMSLSLVIVPDGFPCFMLHMRLFISSGNIFTFKSAEISVRLCRVCYRAADLFEGGSRNSAPISQQKKSRTLSPSLDDFPILWPNIVMCQHS